MIVDHLRLVQEQSAEIWRDNDAMLSLLANWGALERFKLFMRSLRFRTAPFWSSMIDTPWHRVPSALLLRRRWLRILFGQQQECPTVASRWTRQWGRRPKAL
jgi:hypothetical protein